MKKADKKVTISTINSIQAKLRKVHKLKVRYDWSLEAIMIPKMKLCLQDGTFSSTGETKSTILQNSNTTSSKVYPTT